MESSQNYFHLLTSSLGRISGVDLSIASLIMGVVVFCAVLGFSVVIRLVILQRVFNRFQIETGTRHAILTLVRYFFLGSAIYFGLIFAGFNLSSLTVLFGAFGVGIAFGLQNIFQNFMSGLIILFERPIKVGDYIDLGTLSGTIQKISIRSTTLRTNDNVSVIVPNSEFVSSRVVNWSHGSPDVRLRIPIGVAYGSNVDLVKSVLLEIANDHPDVLSSPAASVLFRSFGDSALNFELAIWRKTEAIHPVTLVSDLNFAIDQKFRQHKIAIPFPQRDLHIVSQPANET